MSDDGEVLEDKHQYGEPGEELPDESDVASTVPTELKLTRATATKGGLICPESETDSEDEYACRGRKKKRKRKKKKIKDKVSAFPIDCIPCPHLHFKFTTVDRDELTQKQHTDLLATPKGYVWEPDRELRYIRKGNVIKCKRRKKGQKAKKPGRKKDKQNTGQILCEIWNSLPKNMIENIRQLLCDDFEMSDKDADEFIKQKKDCRQSKGDGTKKKSICHSKGLQCKWIKDFSKIFATKVTDYVVMLLSCRRTPRIRRLAAAILKHLCDITGEKTTLNNPKTKFQRLLVFVSDRLAVWLDSLLKESCEKDVKDVGIIAKLESGDATPSKKPKPEEEDNESEEEEKVTTPPSKPETKPPSKPPPKPSSKGSKEPSKPPSKPSSKPSSKPQTETTNKEESKEAPKEESKQDSKEASETPSKQKPEEPPPDEAPTEIPVEKQEKDIDQVEEQEEDIDMLEEAEEEEDILIMPEEIEEYLVEEEEKEEEEEVIRVASEESIESLPLLPPSALKDTGVVYHITRGDGSYYNVRQLSSGTVAEKVADVRKREKPERKEKKIMTESPLNLETMKDWADWAVRATSVAQEWTKWIDATVNTAETKLKQKRGEPVDDPCLPVSKTDWKNWQTITKYLGDEIAQKKHDLKEEGEIWKMKTEKASERLGPEKETNVIDLTDKESFTSSKRGVAPRNAPALEITPETEDAEEVEEEAEEEEVEEVEEGE